MKPFHHILVNTLIANVTTSYLWFAMTFWVYLETRDVALTGIVNALYMGLIAIGSIFFGSIVDHNRKKNVMMFAAVATCVTYFAAGGVWLALVDPATLGLDDAALWLFALLILTGSVVEHMRNIALSTTVTLLVPEDERDKANGLVGMVQGAAFLVTSVIAGASIGWLGMELTLWIALALTLVALVHLVPIKIPEREILTAAEAAAAAAPVPAEDTAADTTTPVVPAQPGPEGASISKGIDLRGSLKIILGVPGLLALILFTCFNNFIGGVYTALMDPYGLEMFSPQVWGFVLGGSSLGFIAGGMLIAKTGLGKNPVRTLLLANVAVAVLGIVFGLREWWWLYAGGIFLFMLLMPFAEAAEQTILQRVVPFRQQGRVFGLAMAVEMAANPLSAVVIAIVAQAYVIPWMNSPAGQTAFGWLLGEGSTRGMALMFVLSGAIMLVIVLLALISRPYRQLSRYYAEHTQDLAGSQAQ
ncbi:MFS transporter [Corynebacterium sp. A21]|uniref:MFS transporter n=1 Tax=Corynebacterium sp. A21 TaxID=3457318 RepID=UPI003FD34A33